MYIQSTTIDNVQVISKVEVKVKSFKIEIELWIDFRGMSSWTLFLNEVKIKIISALRSNYLSFAGNDLTEAELSSKLATIEVQLRSS